MNKLISIIIPAKNAGKYLEETILAIKNQNMDVEIIVVNDGSEDNTAEIATDNECLVINHENSMGPVIAKNSALKVAKGNYIMFHDADDVMNDNVLSQMYQELENNPEISAVMAKVQDFYSPDLPEDERQKTIIKKVPYYGLFTGAVLIRKEVFDIIGHFDESVTAGEIIDWQTRMNKYNLKIKKLDFVSTNRRIHSSNFGKTQQKKEFKDYASLLRAKLRR